MFHTLQEQAKMCVIRGSTNILVSLLEIRG